jgi:6-phosphofructokinase
MLAHILEKQNEKAEKIHTVTKVMNRTAGWITLCPGAMSGDMFVCYSCVVVLLASDGKRPRFLVNVLKSIVWLR